MVHIPQRDGVYQVTYRGICAGYVIEGEWLVQCAPILLKKIDWWKTIAIRIGD
jgi:hypothetical protein